MRARLFIFAAAAIALTIVFLSSVFAQAAPAPIPMTIAVGGLEADDEAVLRIGVDDGSLNLAGQPLCEYTVNASARKVDINPTLEDGGYLLVVDAPEKYFREPRGYLFRVYQGVVMNPAGHAIQFKLIPPEARDYEPYRGPLTVPGPSTAVPPPGTGDITYRVEAVISLSAPPKQPIQVSIPPTMEQIAASYWVGLVGAGVGVLVVGGVVVLVIVRTTRSLRAGRRGG